jgi:class 3 adenylate cyclase
VGDAAGDAPSDPVPAAPEAAEPAEPGGAGAAERRLVTILFADLVGST